MQESVVMISNNPLQPLSTRSAQPFLCSSRVVKMRRVENFAACTTIIISAQPTHYHWYILKINRASPAFVQPWIKIFIKASYFQRLKNACYFHAAQMSLSFRLSLKTGLKKRIEKVCQRSLK